MRKKVLFGLALCVSLVVCCFGFSKATLAWTDITGTIEGSEIGALFMATDGSMYAGGGYDGNSYARIWKYSGGVWQDISTGLNGSHVFSFVQGSDGSIYAGGTYYEGMISYARVWKCLGTSWLDVTGVLEGSSVNDLLLASDGSIYAGGQYNNFHARVWKYSNEAWSDVANSIEGLNGFMVHDLLQVSDGDIYAGGSYYDGADYYARMWKYSNNVWSNMTYNLSGAEINSLVQTSDGVIYGSGYANNNVLVWKYENGSWQDSLISSTPVNYASQMIVLKNNLYVVGYDELNSETRAVIWSFVDSSWSQTVFESSPSLYTAANALSFGSDGLYAGGYVNGTAKVWKRDYTTEEWRLIEENNLENENDIILRSELDEQKISGQDLTIFFKNLSNKLTKNSAYWMNWQRFNAYPKKWKSPKKTALKRYWKLTTNLNKYKAKKSSQKFKVKVTFKYTKKLLNKLKKKNSLASKSNLTLKYRNKKTSWKNLTEVFTDAKLIKKNKKMIIKYFTHFPKKTNYFAIGMK